jgi:hypothetical protein
MTSSIRSTHVLVYGVCESRFKRYAHEFREALAKHDSWDIVSIAAETVNLATASINRHGDIDLVYFPLELAKDHHAFDVLMFDLELIARAMAEHPRQPWAVVPRELNELKFFFEQHGVVRATDSAFEVAASNRWQELEAKRRLLLTR